MAFADQLALKKTFELRPYQLAAAQAAFDKRRALAVLPTALGKTFIALLAMARLLHENRNAKFLFLTPTKPLALQQARRVEDALDVPPDRVVVLTGETPPAQRASIYAGAHAIIATPQVIENDVLTGKVRLGDFALVVFDEAHRAVGEYSYAFLARETAKTSARILGLTASPSAAREKIDEICRNLDVQHVEVKTERDEDVSDYAQPVKLDWEFVDLPPEFLELKKGLEDLLREPLASLRAQGYLATGGVNVPKRELLEARTRILAAVKTDARAYTALSTQARALNLLHAHELLETQGTAALHAFIEGMSGRKAPSKAVAGLAGDYRIHLLKKQCHALLEKGIDHPKLVRLLERVPEHAHGEHKVLVFAHYRDSVEKITASLNALPGIRAAKLVGRSNQGMTQKQQAKVLEAFRAGEHNVLVATSIGEEGLDIPEVDAVIFYESVPSEIRLIQRRGRTGRVRAGKAIVLVTKGTKDEAFFWIARRKEKEMHDHLQQLQRELKEGAGWSGQKNLDAFE